MKLRWYIERNQFGQRTKPELQFFDVDDEWRCDEWKRVDIEEVAVESDEPWQGS